MNLARSVWDAWLDRDLTDPAAARSLMEPMDADPLMEHPVSRKVNSVRNNESGLRAEIEPETLF